MPSNYWSENNRKKNTFKISLCDDLQQSLYVINRPLEFMDMLC